MSFRSPSAEDLKQNLTNKCRTVGDVNNTRTTGANVGSGFDSSAAKPSPTACSHAQLVNSNSDEIVPRTPGIQVVDYCSPLSACDSVSNSGVVNQVSLHNFPHADSSLFPGSSAQCRAEMNSPNGQCTPVLASMSLSHATQHVLQRPRHRPAPSTQPIQQENWHLQGALVEQPRHENPESGVYNGVTSGMDQTEKHSRPPAEARERSAFGAKQAEVDETIQRSLLMIHSENIQALQSQLRAELQTQMRNLLLQMEIRLQDRLDALLQIRLQTTNVAESRVYLNQMHAMRVDFQEQISRMQAETREEIDNIYRQIDIEANTLTCIGNISDSNSSLSTVPSSVVSE